MTVRIAECGMRSADTGCFALCEFDLIPKSAFGRMQMDLPLRTSLDDILSRLIPTGPLTEPGLLRKVLFSGEGTEEIASYVAGWMAEKGKDVIVLDGANRFNPYTVSFCARKASISPEKLLKRIRIARAFTCYQMATLMGERLPSLFGQERATPPPQNPWVILLGPVTTFLDEDVSEGEIRPLFERSLRKVEGMVREGIPFFLFQPPIPSHSKRAYLMRRLFQFPYLVWRIDADDQGPKMVLEKRFTANSSLNPKHEIRNSKQIPTIKAQNSRLVKKDILEI